jgi:signal transduction histidine kinase
VGFGADFLERFRRVPVGTAPCGKAITAGRPVIVEDVESASNDGLSREAARHAGYRATYATPLRTRTGELVGTLTNCFRKPYSPPLRQVRLVEIYGRQAADIIEIARLYRECREAGRRTDEFLGTLAHELRMPISVIVSLTNLMREDPQDAMYLDHIERQAWTIDRLVDDVFDIASVGLGMMELRSEPLDLGPVLNEVAQAIRPQVEARGLTLSVEVPEGLLRLNADRTRPEQVVTNLLTNAMKHTQPGGAIRLSARREGREAVVRVHDTGIGMSPELLDYIFEPFVKGKAPNGKPNPGLGLGLALVRRLVELHGGTVAAASEGLGRGSEFRVRLPLSVSS